MELMTSSWRRINDLDLALCLRANRFSRYSLLCLFFRGVSRLGDGVFWYVLMGAMLAAEGMAAAPTVLRMMVAGCVCLAIYKWLKTKTSRPRPYQVYVAISAAAPALDRFSFPSGHTLHAVCFATVATSAYPGLAIYLWPFVALVAISRPVLGLHYPSDVLAGATIGLTIASIALAIGF